MLGTGNCQSWSQLATGHWKGELKGVLAAAAPMLISVQIKLRPLLQPCYKGKPNLFWVRPQSPDQREFLTSLKLSVGTDDVLMPMGPLVLVGRVPCVWLVLLILSVIKG